MILLSWDGLESDSTETCSVSESEESIQVESTVHGAFGECLYTVIAGDHWQFRSLTLVLGARSLRIGKPHLSATDRRAGAILAGSKR